MLVVADSSPLRYLLLIGQIDILPKLFGQVVIPPTVAEELSHVNTPRPVRDFISQPPSWLDILTPQSVEPIPDIDLGECAAINLVLEIKADLLLIDDLDGRQAALARGISIAGTLGVLKLAAKRALLSLPDAIEKLQQSGFHASSDVLKKLLEESE
ncbi:MAG: DUF3368 domain-containing protein [Planctomycetes bacterium]|nr:DUF3368 domain-containing protein [Planctomycetota bacterium]